MKRGEVWTVAGGPGYAGKPRPVVIVQDDDYDGTRSVTVCSFTSDPLEALFRVPVDPSPENGLHGPSSLMIDKIAAVPRERLGRRIGLLEAGSIRQMERAIVIFLGLSGALADA